MLEDSQRESIKRMGASDGEVGDVEDTENDTQLEGMGTDNE